MSTARRESVPIVKYGVRLPNRRVYGGMLADESIVWIARIAWWGIRAFLVIVAIVVIQRFCAAGCQGVTGGFECPEPDCPSHSR